VDTVAVPSYGGPIVGQLQQMQTQIAALQTQLGGAPPSASSASGASANGGFTQSAPAQSSADAPLANQAAMAPSDSSQSTPASGGFSQDTSGQSNANAAPAAQDASASGGFSQDTSATGGATADPTATASGFTQDASATPTSQFVQTTCADAVQSLQTIFTSVVTAIPQFATQFKNLNNLFAGLNMVSTMMSSASQIKNDFVALKKAPNTQAALAALANLSTAIQNLSQGISTQFSSLTASVSTAGGAIGSQAIGNQAVGNQVTGAPAAPAATGQPASTGATAGQTAGSTASSTASAAAGAATGKAVNKLKGKLPPF
jgi:hypothetical protein